MDTTDFDLKYRDLAVAENVLNDSEERPAPTPPPKPKWHKPLVNLWQKFLPWFLQCWLVLQFKKLWDKVKQGLVWLRMKPHERISEEELNRAIELAEKYIELVRPRSKEIYPPYQSGDSLCKEFKGCFNRRGKRYGGGNGFVKPTDVLEK